jgi:lysozyme family protein
MNKIRQSLLLLIAVLGCVCLTIYSCTDSQSASVLQSQSKKFNYAMSVVLIHEGGLSDDKNDPGGITRYGISLRYIKSQHIDIDGDGDSNRDDIIKLTQSDADRIYLIDWWSRYGYEKINDIHVATKLMDASVNMGASRAHKLAKQALNAIHHQLIPINGTLDSRTIALINTTEPSVMMDALRAQEERFYRDIVRRNPHLRCFLTGWIKRSSW